MEKPAAYQPHCLKIIHRDRIEHKHLDNRCVRWKSKHRQFQYILDDFHLPFMVFTRYRPTPLLARKNLQRNKNQKGKTNKNRCGNYLPHTYKLIFNSFALSVEIERIYYRIRSYSSLISRLIWLHPFINVHVHVSSISVNSKQRIAFQGRRVPTSQLLNHTVCRSHLFSLLVFH